jgi:hypothetical protein
MTNEKPTQSAIKQENTNMDTSILAGSVKLPDSLKRTLNCIAAQNPKLASMLLSWYSTITSPLNPLLHDELAAQVQAHDKLRIVMSFQDGKEDENCLQAIDDVIDAAFAELGKRIKNGYVYHKHMASLYMSDRNDASQIAHEIQIAA